MGQALAGEVRGASFREYIVPVLDEIRARG